MAKWHGRIGFGSAVEISPGVYEDQIEERNYYGDVIRNSRQLVQAEGRVNDDIHVGNSISIVADAHLRGHFFAIRYVEWEGALWTVSDVDVQAPRLILKLGGVYHGPTA